MENPILLTLHTSSAIHTYMHIFSNTTTAFMFHYTIPNSVTQCKTAKNGGDAMHPRNALHHTFGKQKIVHKKTEECQLWLGSFST